MFLFLIEINILKCFSAHTWLCLGIVPAPNLIQHTIEQLLHGIPESAFYVDDILSFNVIVNEHNDDLRDYKTQVCVINVNFKNFLSLTLVRELIGKDSRTLGEYV